MKNALLVNNFLQEPPKTAFDKQNGRGTSRPGSVNSYKNTTYDTLSLDRPASRQSSDFQSPRDISSRLGNKLKSKLSQDRRWDFISSQNLDSDEDISVSDQEDDYVDETFGKANNYWAALDDSLKKINDDSDKFALKPRPNFRSSEVFKDVMHEMSGNVEYGVSKGYTLLKQKISRLANVTSITALALSKASKSEQEEEKKETDNKKDESDSEDESQAAINLENKEKDLVSAVGGAKRAWRVLKTHVTETGVEHRTTVVKMNWEALRHHVAGITDLERARQDLYQRYGILPTVQEDGSKVCKNVMWLNRTRAQIMQNQTNNLLRGKLRAHSARPFTTQNSRPRTLSANGSNGYSSDVPNGARTKPRPFSERPRVAKNHSRPSSVQSKKSELIKL